MYVYDVRGHIRRPLSSPVRTVYWDLQKRLQLAPWTLLTMEHVTVFFIIITCSHLVIVSFSHLNQARVTQIPKFSTKLDVNVIMKLSRSQ